jgi:CHAT domain-containing protein
VVGTLWPVGDRTAYRVAAAFYARLTGNGDHAPDADESAPSLHHAIRDLRAKNPDAPVQWTAHVHIGV